VPDLAVGILAANSEDDIGPCLESVSWAQERVVILDTRSTDRTAEIAASMGAHVVPHRFVDFARQRQFGLQTVGSPWLFYLDVDERVTPALAHELREAIADSGHVGWWVPRRNIIFGHEVRHGGWYPDYQLRLLRRDRASYDLARKVHETVRLRGKEGFLREPLIHHNYRTLGQFVRKQRQYVDMEAEIRWLAGVRPKPWTWLSQAVREFWRRYVVLGGFKDGFIGLLLCALVAYYYGSVVTWRLAARWRRAIEDTPRSSP